MDKEVRNLRKLHFEKEKYELDKELEQELLTKIAKLQLPEQTEEKCNLLKQLAYLYFHSGQLHNTITIVEQIDSFIFDQPYSPQLSFIYYIRSEFALLYNDWTYVLEFCEQGITIAQRLQQFDYVGQFYRILQQLALNDGRFEDAITLGRLAMFFARKQQVPHPYFIQQCEFGTLQAYLYLDRLERANELILDTYKGETEDSHASVLVEIAKYLVDPRTTTLKEDRIKYLLKWLFDAHQYNTVKSIIRLIKKKYSHIIELDQCLLNDYSDFEADEQMIRHFEKLAYHDQLRAVFVTNGDDEKMGYHSGESFRKLLNTQFNEADDEKYIAIITFIIHVNEPDLLNKNIKIKYEQYLKINQDFSELYPQSLRGKYYPTSFCAMFIADEPLDMQKIGNDCQRYLDQMDFMLEGKQIHYDIHMGGSCKQKKLLHAVHDIYQEAEQSLYYARVTHQPIVIFGK